MTSPHYLVPLLQRDEPVSMRQVLLLVFAILFAASVFVQYVGAFHYPRGAWNNHPVDIIDNHARAWDWSDLQIAREFHAPAKRGVLRLILKKDR